MITVGIPTFNRADFLREALNSLVNQTNQNFKVLVVDNASQDNTKDIVKDFEDLLNIKYIVNDENIGMTGNWNVLVENSDTEYLKFLMDDDLFYPDCIQGFYDCIQNTDNVVLFATLNNNFHSEISLPAKVPFYVPEKEIGGLEMLNFLNQWTNQIGCPTNVMIKLDVFRKNIAAWKSKRNLWTIDILAFAELLNYGNFYCINSPLVAIRTHENRMTNKILMKNMLDEEIVLIKSISILAGNSKITNKFAELHIARLTFVKIIDAIKIRDFIMFKYFIKEIIKKPKALGGILMYCDHLLSTNYKNKFNKLVDFILNRERVVFRFTSMSKYWDRK